MHEKKKKENKTKRVTKIDEIQAQLCDILGGSQRHVVDEDDDDDFCIYLVDMHPNEWNVYLVVVGVSKVNWMRLTTTKYICGNQSIKQRSFQVLVMHQDKCENHKVSKIQVHHRLLPSYSTNLL